MSDDKDSVDLQIAQLVLAKQTTELIIRGCPESLKESLLKSFEECIQSLKDVQKTTGGSTYHSLDC